MAYRILVPQPGIEPMPPEVEAWSLNHWTAREVPPLGCFEKSCEIIGVVYKNEAGMDPIANNPNSNQGDINISMIQNVRSQYI